LHQNDFDAFADMMLLVAEQYSKKPSDGLIALYWQGLKGYDFQAVQDAVGRHLGNTDTGQYMPKIADIIRMMTGSTLDAALVAWAKVDRAVRTVGPYESVVFDDPLIHRVLHDMGGWCGLGSKTDDEWPFVAREFENRYRGFKSRNERVDYPAKMIGIHEAHNAKEGHRVAFPTLIGDKAKAQEVLALGTSGAVLMGIARMGDAMRENVERITEKHIAGGAQ